MKTNNSHSISRQPETRHWLTLIFLSIIWGSSFILIKRGLDVFPPVQVGSIRVIFAYIVMLPAALIHLRKIPTDRWKYIVIMGALGNFFPAFFFAMAQTQLPSSVSGVLNALTPLFTLLIGVAFFTQPLRRKQLSGLALSFLGAAALSVVSSQGGLQFNFYVLFVIAATLCYATSTNIIKNYLSGIKPFTLTSMAMFIAGPPAIIILFTTTDFTERVATAEGVLPALGYLALLGIMGTSVALVIFNRVLQETSAVFAASVTYLIPLVAVCWGIFDGETLYTAHYISMLAILIGVYIANRK